MWRDRVRGSVPSRIIRHSEIGLAEEDEVDAWVFASWVAGVDATEDNWGAEVEGEAVGCAEGGATEGALAAADDEAEVVGARPAS